MRNSKSSKEKDRTKKTFGTSERNETYEVRAREKSISAFSRKEAKHTHFAYWSWHVLPEVEENSHREKREGTDWERTTSEKRPQERTKWVKGIPFSSSLVFCEHCSFVLQRTLTICFSRFSAFLSLTLFFSFAFGTLFSLVVVVLLSHSFSRCESRNRAFLSSARLEA